VLASAAAIAVVPFYVHWFTGRGYAALASDSLRVWLDFGLALGIVAFVGSFFGRGIWRVAAALAAIAELYYWFVLSIAV